MNPIMAKLIDKYPELSICQQEIENAFQLLKTCYKSGGKVLVCGNGGSAADSEHIVGELMKGFMLKRAVPEQVREKLQQLFPQNGYYLADHLQEALPAISLVSHSALMTAFENDVAADMVFAQQVYGYGTAGDVLIGISTSGNSKNVVHACQIARLMGVRTLALTGRSGGLMQEICDVAIRVPWDHTPDVQERHLPIYHALCIMIEEEFFAK